MAAASDRVVTVFGGTGFLGRRIVRHLRLHDFCVRVASRHPDRGDALLPPDDPHLRSIKVEHGRLPHRQEPAGCPLTQPGTRKGLYKWIGLANFSLPLKAIDVGKVPPGAGDRR